MDLFRKESNKTQYIRNNALTPGYIKLDSPMYTKPTSFLFDGSLPLVPPIYSNDPTVLTVYGQGAYIDIYYAKVKVSTKKKHWRYVLEAEC